MAAVSAYRERLEQRVLQPLTHAGRGWYVVFGLLSIVFVWGLYAYYVQLRDGLVSTGMRDRIFWGLYIANFVFFVGISMAGTLVSGMLRMTQAPWRTPITRMAEIVTLLSLLIGGLMPTIDLGRPDRMANLFLHGRWQSPILWDFLAITTYIVASAVYLYLPLIPDMAIARDRLAGRVGRLKQWIFRATALGWRGTEREHRVLNRAMGVMMLAIVPIAASAHTVVAWIFATTLREPWDTALFGIFFVGGAIFSGVAFLVLLMALLRRVYHLEEYIHDKHFMYMGYMVAAAAAVMLYFNINDYLVTGYKENEEIAFNFNQMFRGEFAGFFWFYLVGGLFIPLLIIAWPRTRTVRGIIFASALVVVAMWIERYFIVIASLRIPLMSYEPRTYVPSWVEISIVAWSFAALGMGIMLFLRLVPIISIWEQLEHHEPQEERAEAEVEAAPGVLAPAPAGGGDA